MACDFIVYFIWRADIAEENGTILDCALCKLNKMISNRGKLNSSSGM